MAHDEQHPVVRRAAGGDPHSVVRAYGSRESAAVHGGREGGGCGLCGSRHDRKCMEVGRLAAGFGGASPAPPWSVWLLVVVIWLRVGRSDEDSGLASQGVIW